MNNKSASWLKSKLKANQGFILLNNIIMMASLFALIISMMVILKSITTSLVFFVDNWMLQTESQRILEDIVTEINYAEMVNYEDDFKSERRIIIVTRRRATKMINDEPKILGYFNKGDIIYRQELERSDLAGKYKVVSTQPLNSYSFWGTNNMQFYVKKLDDKLYQINIQAQAYKSQQSLFMQTTVLQRNNEIKENDTS